MDDICNICENCGQRVPRVRMNEVAWFAVSRCLSRGSAIAAASELVSLGVVNKANSDRWIEHLRNCIFSWPIEPSAREVIDQVDEAFLSVKRPDHFADADCCDECKAHDEMLRSKAVRTIARRDLGNQGWNPIAFSSADGLAYYFPALARMAIIPALSEDQDPYVIMLAPKLSSGRGENDFLNYCDRAQRRAVASLICWIGENEGSLDCYPLSSSDFDHGWQSWDDGFKVWSADAV